MLTRLITDPKAFVERQSKYPGFRTQTILTILVGIAFAMKHAGTYFLLDDAWGHISQAVWVYSLVELIVPFALWGAVSIIIYYSARRFEGYFSIGLLFRLAGWGMAPLIAAGSVQTIARLYVLDNMEPPQEPEFAAIQYYIDSYTAYTESVPSEPVFILGTLVAVPFLLYSGYIWATTVSYIGDMDLKEGLYVSALPTLLALLWLLSPWLI